MIRAVGVRKIFRPPLTVRGLFARRAPVVALDGVDFTVERGEIAGVMGKNGAGKSTLLRVLAGLVTPTAGSVTVDGLDAARGGPRLARAIGYVAGDDRGLSPQLSPREHLAFFAALHGLARAAALRRADELLDLVGLRAEAARPLRDLSTGQRRRAALARGLIGAPAALLLDEPTRGVDPAGAEALRAHFRAAAEKGVAIVLATHDRDEARALCARVAVLEAGRVLALESAADAVARLAGAGAALG